MGSSSSKKQGSHLQLKFPPATLERVWPPRMQLRIQNPHIPIRLKIHGTMTPKYLRESFTSCKSSPKRWTHPNAYLACIICLSPSLGPHVVLDSLNTKWRVARGRRAHRYAGGNVHSRLKNKMTKQESRTPSPKTIGPRDPAEKDRMLQFQENHKKKFLKYWVSIRSSGWTGSVPGVKMC